MMTVRQFNLRFLTPAFLGNAERDGQWRSPPIKALLRQWWRVAWTEANDYRDDVKRLRQDEGALFGAAADGSSNRSLVRLRLGRWDTGSLKKSQWTHAPKVAHPEVKFAVDSSLYMGYGPVVLPKGKKEPTLMANAAIQPGESAELRIAFPVAEALLLDRALALMDAYGTLGGRSRNGWGSFVLQPLPEEGKKSLSPGERGLDKGPLRNWLDCLDRDWPHAIGRDDQGPLIWRTEPFDDWKTLMRRLAEVKIGLRRQFRFNSGRNAQRAEERHWLSYPVTNHSVKTWNNNARLPNSLRFKAHADKDGQLRGVIFHVPCLPPSQFRPDRSAIEGVWQQVHRFLDKQNDLIRRTPK